MALIGAVAGAVLAGSAWPALAQARVDPECAMSASDRVWVKGSLDTWARVSQQRLKLRPAAPPTIVTFDARCGFTLKPGAVWQGTPHGGQVALPDGQTVPAAVVSFAAPTGRNGGAFFVMSLPSVWRAAGVQSGLGLERLMTSVLLHEMAHTRQFYFADPRLRALTKLYGLPDNINDDSLQAAFKGEAAYVAAFEAERDLLYAAVAAEDTAEAKRLARLALDRMRERRAKWFVGERAQWAGLDEIFLTMEGLGQWAAYAGLLEQGEPGQTQAQLLKELRRGGRFWSQDAGLGLFLAVDRLLPGWQVHAFAEEPWTAERLLAAAAY